MLWNFYLRFSNKHVWCYKDNQVCPQRCGDTFQIFHGKQLRSQFQEQLSNACHDCHVFDWPNFELLSDELDWDEWVQLWAFFLDLRGEFGCACGCCDLPKPENEPNIEGRVGAQADLKLEGYLEGFQG